MLIKGGGGIIISRTWLREAERRDADKATRGWAGRTRPKEIK